MIKLIILFPLLALSSSEIFDFYKSHWKLPKRVYKAAIEKKLIVDSVADNVDKNKQEFLIQSLGHYPKPCTYVLPRLTQFEKYKSYIPFVTDSNYQEKSKLLTIKASHALLPYDMIVHIFTPRPQKQGEYSFSFPTGIFQGLKGKLYVKDIHKSCNFYVKANWKGQHTKIPATIIEIFSEGLTKLAAQNLIRKTLK